MLKTYWVTVGSAVIPINQVGILSKIMMWYHITEHALRYVEQRCVFTIYYRIIICAALCMYRWKVWMRSFLCTRNTNLSYMTDAC